MSIVSPCDAGDHCDDYNSDMYEGTRSANRNDVVSIEQLLRPLEENGVLVHRSREQVKFTTMTNIFAIYGTTVLTSN